MEVNSLVTLILASISGILLVYNFILGRKLNNRRNEEIEEVEREIKESKDASNKIATELNDLIKQYRKLRKRDSNKSDK